METIESCTVCLSPVDPAALKYVQCSGHHVLCEACCAAWIGSLGVKELKGRCSSRNIQCPHFSLGRCSLSIKLDDISHVLETKFVEFSELAVRAARFFGEDLIEALTIHCPRISCNAILDLNPAACAAITCGGCGQHFCGCCHARFRSSREAHLHVPLAHSWQDVFLPRASVVEGQRRIRLVQLNSFLATGSCPAVLDDLLSDAREQLQGLDLPTTWEDIHTQAEEAQMALTAQRRTTVNDEPVLTVGEGGGLQDAEAVVASHRGNAVIALCWANRFDAVRIRIDEYARNGLDVLFDWTQRSVGGDTAFNCAARLPNNFHGVAAMQLLLELGAEGTINALDSDGFSALHRFVMLNDIASVKFILQQPGADLEVTTAEGRTPLFLAAEVRHLHIAREPMRRGAYVFTSDSVGTTVLMALAFRCSLDKVTPGELQRNIQFWVGAGADVEAADGQAAWRALHYAAAGRYDTGSVAVRELLRCKADLRAQTRFNQTPLMIAVCFGNVDAIKVLVAAEGINPSVPFECPVADLVLNEQAEGQRIEIAKMLKEAQAWERTKHGWRQWLGFNGDRSGNMTTLFLVSGVSVGVIVGVAAVLLGVGALGRRSTVT
jgi:ankyrin repeat protein